MNKSKYGKLSILVILIATLFISAAIAIFGLTTNKGTGANSSAEISAPEKDASSAIVDGEVTDDGEISAPEVEAKATATYTSMSSWSTAVASSGNTIQLTSSQALSTTSYTVPAGITLTLDLNDKTLTMANTTEFVVNGTLTITNTASGTGTIQRVVAGTAWMFTVNSGGRLNVRTRVTLKGTGSSTADGCVEVNGGTFAMSGGTIKDCKTNVSGGGVRIINSGTFAMSGGTITNCAGQYGGAVYIGSGTFNHTGGTLSENSARLGGAVYSGNSGTYTQYGTTACLYNNSASSTGGAVYCTGTYELKIGYVGNYVSGTDYGNSAGSGTNAGGVYMGGSGTFTMTGGAIRNNKANTGKGGGVYVGGSANFSMSGGTIGGATYGNSAVGGGGGVFFDTTGTCTMSGGYISYNSTAEYGGGVHISKGTFTMSGGTISNHSGIGNGAGVYVGAGTFSHTGGTITGNSGYNGAGVYISSVGSYTQNGTNANVYKNSAGGSGAGVYVSGGTYNLQSGNVGGSDNANTAQCSGGGVYVSSGTFNMSGGSVSYNSQINSSISLSNPGGGGVYVNGGTFNLSGGSISKNTVSSTYSGSAKAYGAGVNVCGSGKFTMTNGTIGGSSMGNSGAHSGGGVYFNTTGTCTMSGGTISYNSATSEGGGVHIDGSSTFTMSGGTIGNHSGVGGGGGVLVSKDATFSHTGGTISNNSAANGGGVYVSGTYTQNGTNANVYKNGGQYGGGGVYVGSNGTYNLQSGNVGASGNANYTLTYGGGVVVSGGTFNMSGGNVSYNNQSNTSLPTSTTYGGGVYVSSGTFTMSGGTIGNNGVANGYTGGTAIGGGVYVGGGKFTMSSGTITSNIGAENGGGVYVNGSATFSMTGGQILSNTATGNGGGVYLNTSVATTKSGGYIGYESTANSGNSAVNGAGVYVAQGTFTQSGGEIDINVASENGGGVYVPSGAKFVLSGGYIDGNSAKKGGGVYNAGTLEITGGYVGYSSHHNTASQGGGGVCSASTFTMSGGTIQYNDTGDGYAGGGVRIDGSTFTMTGGTISNNSAKASGGGIYVNAGTLSISGTSDKKSNIISNTAGVNGGGICMASGTTITLGDYTEIYSNTAEQGGGGIYSNVALTINKANTKIYSNTGKQNGGGIYQTGAKLTISNGYIYSNKTLTTNKAYGLGGGIYANANVEMSGGYIHSNSSIYGGGVYIANAANTFTMSGGYIGRESATSTTTGNTADRNGGGVYIQANATFTKTGGYIEYNEALGTEGTSYGYGGGVACLGTFNMTTNAANYIRYNTAYVGGGVAMYGTSKTFTFSAGTIGNNTVSGNGGGIQCGGSSTVAMSGSAIVSSNNAYETTSRGGGVYVSVGTFNFSGGTIKSNEASNGGGVAWVGGTFTMSGGTIGGSGSGNTAYENGGGVYISGANLNFKPSGGTISYNYSSAGYGSGGGGVCVDNSTAKFTLDNANVTFTNNGATVTGGVGGGVYVKAGSFVMSAGSIKNSQAAEGGGVYVGGSGTCTISGGTIGGNGTGNAGSYGGGVYINTTGTCTISGGTISYNTNVGNGGALYVNAGTLNFTGGTVSNNGASYGGGVLVAGGTLNMSGTASVTTNTVSNANGFGGGVLVNGGTFNLSGGTITANSVTGASGVGGGVTVISGTFKMTGGTIGGSTANANTAKAGGGGVYVSNGTVTISAGTISYNTATTGATTGNAVDGGGVYVAGGSVTVSGSANVLSNSATQNGGGIYVSGGTLNVSGGSIMSNTAGAGGYGGGIYVSGGTLNLSGSTISKNSATYGAGVGVGGSATFKMTGGTIGGGSNGSAGPNTNNGGNSANGEGGGLYFASSTAGTISGGTISYNSAYAGGGVRIASGTLNHTGGTISYNRANTGGGGGVNNAGTFTQNGTDANIYKNAVYGSGGGVYNTGTYTFTKGNVGGNNNGNEAYTAGGGVYNSGTNATFTLQGGTIGYNDNVNPGMTSGTVYGAGVYIASGTFTFTSGYINNNKVSNSMTEVPGYNVTVGGGGVYFGSGTFNMSGGSISGNSVGPGTTYGGGVYVNGGTFTMSGGTIHSSTATNGGGLYIAGGTVNHTGGYIGNDGGLGNTATNGGGVYVAGGTYNLSGGNVAYNTATNGAGVYVNGSSTFKITSGYICANQATSSGGGVYLNTTVTTAMSGGYIGVSAPVDNGSTNRASSNGGGVYVAKGTFNVTAGEISRNSASDGGGGVFVNTGATFSLSGGKVAQNTADGGGGVCVVGGTFNLSGGTVGGSGEGNSSWSMGGGVCWVSGTFTMTGGTISYNTASQNGGGVYVGGANLNFAPTGGTISNNSISGSYTGNGGGGVCINNSTASITLANANVTISNNTANNGGYGGGVYVAAGASFTMSAGTLSGNGALYGGNVYIASGTFSLSGGTITRGSTQTGGGGVYLDTTGTCTISGGTISSNSGAGYGGGVYINKGKLTFSNGTIGSGNSAANGGGVYIASGATLEHTGGTITGGGSYSGGGVYNAGTYTQNGANANVYSNSSQGGGGGGVYNTGTYTLTNGNVGGSNNANTSYFYGGGVYSSGTFNMSGGTIANNGAVNPGDPNASIRGGGVYVDGGTFTMTGGTISSNSASSGQIQVGPSQYVTPDGFGGGVYVAGGTFNLAGGSIIKNSATNGGGVYIAGDSTFNLTSGTVGGSTANANTATNGAGIYLAGSNEVSIAAGTVSYNTATQNGGGVYIANSATLNMSDSLIISYNSAKNGGGVYVGGGKFNLSTGSITHNSATSNGGGVYVASGTFEMTGGTIGGTGSTYANTAYYGGGVYNAGTTTLSGGAISYNTAGSGGGGVYNTGILNVSETVEISNNTADGGGGLIVSGSASQATVSGGKIINNKGNEAGGGVLVYNSGTLNMTDGLIDGNNSSKYAGGGGVYVVGDSSFHLSGGKISNNTTTGYGGGVYVDSSSFTMDGGEIYKNNASRGGGVYAQGGTLTVSGGTIGGSEQNANSAEHGGGVYIYNNCIFNMAGGTISYNTATTENGGGVLVNNSTLNMTDGEVSNNSATVNGGGVYVASGTVNMSGGEISSNTATVNGGGIYLATGAANVTGGEVSGNTAEIGGGAYVKSGILKVTDARITENTATKSYGAGVYVEGGKIQLGGTAYILGNTYNEKENNVYVNKEKLITIASTLTSGAQIGVTCITKEELILTEGFTAAGHTAADIEKYFVADMRGTTLKYVNDEIVVKFDLAYAWNETIKASTDNDTTETFILYFDWEPENGSFGSGIGFTGLGVILVPGNASVIFDFNGFNVDRKGTEGSTIRVEGTLIFDSSEGGSIKGGNAEHGGALYIYGGNVILENSTLCDNEASYGGAVFIDNGGEFTMNGGSIVRNTAENGGAIYVKEGVATINGGVIGGSVENKNEATLNGGAIYVANGGVVTVEDGEISNNVAVKGAGVYVDGGKFYMNDGTVTENTAENGGGLYADGGVVVLSGGEISANVAENGAGVYVMSGTVTVDGVDICDNEAENGAGAYVDGGTLSMSDGLIDYNEATENGGGVYVTGNTTKFNLSGGEIFGNIAKNGLGVYVNGGTVTVSGDGAITSNERDDNETVNGAGVYLEKGTLNVTGGEISDNTATLGGGVYMAGGELNLSDDGAISGNTAENGGAVYVAGGTFNMTNGAIGGNVAPNGGGVYVGGESTFNLSGGTIGGSDNSNSAQYGGGVYVNGGSFNMTGGAVAYNNGTIYYGGGVYLRSGTFTMSDGTIGNNTAYNYGGGVLAAGGSFEMTGGTISNNVVSSGNGGGVFVSGCSFEMSGGEISGNTATYGGGVYVDGGTAQFTVSDGTISNNSATLSGGGVYVKSAFEMTGGVITENGAQNGAGVYVASNTLDFSAGEISNNTATGATTTYGGGVYVNTDAELKISGTAQITGNTAILGGGVYNAGTLNITAGAISENTASSGGGVYIDGGSAEITDGEITGNGSTDASASAGGGGVFVLSGSLTVSGTAQINGNSAAGYGGGIRIDGSTDSATVEMSDGFLNGNTATYGGGAYVSGNFAYLTLTDTATVSENEATYGGGVAVANGAAVEVEGHAYITNNTASLNGGGAFVTSEGELIVEERGAITYNTAENGGGVYVAASGEFVMENGSLSYNEATANGGAVNVTGGTFTLEDGKIVGNTAAANGGAVYVAANSASAFNMNGGAIGGEDDEVNKATLGGGLYVAGGTATLTSGEIKYNEAAENGAGVYFNAGTLAIKGNPVISNNTLLGSDSNLYLYNGKTITVIGKLTEGAHIGVTGTDKLTEGFAANDNGEDEREYFVSDVIGAVLVINVGEIYIQISLENAWNAAVQASLDKGGKPVTFVLAEIWRATDGSFNEEGGVGFTEDGALYLPQGAYVVLNLNGYSINRDLTTATENGSVIYVDGSLEISGMAGYITGGNSENGGGIYVNDGGYLKLTVGNIQNNTATENGGGVYVASGARFEMTGGAIRSNSAKSGGAVYIEANGEFTISGGTLGSTGNRNTAENGGAVYTEGSFTMAGGTVTLNAATENGGGVYVAGGEAIAKSGTISSNTAKNGAGVYVAGGEFTLDGATITQNTATENGGGVYVASGATFEQVDGVISNNNAINGGGVYNAGTATLTGGKITLNTVSSLGGGVSNSGTLSISGTVEISGNDASLGAGGVLVTGSSAQATISGGKIINNNSSDVGGGVMVNGGSTLTMTDGLIDGNTAGFDGAGGVFVTENNTKFNLSGGKISNNSTTAIGGGVGVVGGTFTMTGGEISDNTATAGGGVYNRGTTVLNGGKITSNTGSSTAGGVYNEATLTISGTAEISNNTTNGGGGGITTYGSNAQTTIDGGLINGNTAESGGGVYATNGGSVVMNDGEISGNEATRFGGGVNVANGAINASFEMNGGKISGNSASVGSGVFLTSGTVKITDGEISGNTGISGAGVYLSGGKGIITGGKITGNSVTGGAGGMFVESGAIFEIEGSPMIYGNTANGVESNVYLVANKTITVTGMLSVNGKIAYVGISMADPSKKKFTTGFAANNTDYNPDLLPATVFFSDDTDYMVSLENGEAVLVENDYSQTSLVWQLSKDGENTWISIDVPTFSLKYKAGETYSVRALNAEGEEVALTWATGESGDIDASNFAGIGSYKFVVNSNNYLNPALTVEITPATLFWQYSTDEGRTWFDVTGDTTVYTADEYNVRAIVYDTDNENGYVIVQSFVEIMKDVGSYEYTVTDAELYENPTLNYTITTRYITVEWNFGDALGDATNGYYWEYDGLVHTPIAVLSGVSNKLAGVDLSYGYDWSGGQSFASASAYAGDYTLTVGLMQADDNVVLSNTTVTYKINGVTLTLTFVDKDGNEGDEFTYEYDSETHGVDFILNGVVTGDTVGAYITYASRLGKVLSEAPSAVGYYTATVKLPADCYNYVFDKTYICEIVITAKTLEVQWQPNTDGTYEWTFNGLGKAPVASIINPYTGEEISEAYKIEYAPVASNGTIGRYTTTQPVNAGNYVVRLTLTNPDANFVLVEDTTTQRFTIKKLDVSVTWKGATYDADKDVYFWYYNGEEHDLEAEISLVGLAVNKGGVIISSLDIERTDARTKLVSVGSATATIVLLNDPFNANFNITNSTSQVYEVRKAVITAVEWTDKLSQKFTSDDRPEYDFGTISGADGPAFVATALDGAVTLVVTYNKSYAGDWVVDETNGYTAYARLSAADAVNYEFANGAKEATITFLINSVGGFKTDIDVTWVVFINEHEYVTLEQYIDEGGFVYNGKVQNPTPIYLQENGIDYEVLELQPSSIGADAGQYTARLKPSSVYDIKVEDFTCNYEIKKLNVVISWQDGKDDSNTTFTYTYSGSEQAPYAYVSGNYDFEIAITVNGKTNAGTYVATAVAGNNFNITSGKTQVYSIAKKGLSSGLVKWDYVSAGASGNEDDGWYWIYDGKEHAPVVTIPAANWGGEFDIELVVTGATSEIGTHSAYAVLNSSIPEHNNFYLTDTSSTTFEIVQVKAGKVYWEDAEGHVYEDGKGGDTGLAFTYNGDTEGQAPKAYYVDENGEKVYLTVTVIGGTAVDAGTYTAYVSSELDFASAMPTCTFKINAMEITVEWDGDTTITFNGDEQSPAVTLSKGAADYVLEEGVDYEVTGFIKAGKHTAEIKFINTNYTCAAGAKTFEFEIEKVVLSEIDGEDITEGFVWGTTGYDEDSETYVWTYDGIEHSPVLTVTYTIDGEEVVFEIGYAGVTSEVGKHKVTAYVKSATLNGEDITDNFNLEAEMEYEIVSVSVSIDWDWSGASSDVDEDGNTYYFWTYDGTKHAPKAYLKDADGNRIKNAEGNDLELDVYGGEINARDAAYTLTAVVPSQYNFTGDNTHKYFVKKATIEVVWDFGDNAEYDGDTGVYSWTYGEEAEPKAYVKVTSTDEEGNVIVTKGAELTVTGFETDAGTHTLTVMHSDGNYMFASDDEAIQTYVINPKEVYVIWYGAGGLENNDTSGFEWTYGDENPVPTAYLAVYREGKLELLLDANDNPIPVEVSGASNEIGTHTAQVVDTFVNYVFVDDAEYLTKKFTITAKDATGFEWTADGATVSEDGLTYTYEYSGKNNLPVPSSSVDGLKFNVEIKMVKADGNKVPVLAITEVGTYEVTATSQNGNYKVPDGKNVITVEVTAKTVEVEWEDGELVYNGADQKPKAYYTDVDGNRIELDVTVEGDSANVGETYTAVATLTSTNYVLDTATATETFEITAKTISVKWGDTEFDYDGSEHAPLPEIVLTAAEKDGIDKVLYEIKDKDGNVVAGTNEDVKKVVNAGEYTIKIWLEGPAAGNYALDVDEITFNVYALTLTITANDKQLTYGDSLLLTIDDCTIEGLIDSDVSELWGKLDFATTQWLICHYTRASLPGTYTIYVDASYLNDMLVNYNVTGVNGKLTVTPAAGKLLWQADKYAEDGTPVFTYDGEANLPEAFYYDERDTKVPLNVKLATLGEDGEYVVSDGEAVNASADYYYAVIVDGDGNVIKGHGSCTFENYGVKFIVEKREIVINLNELKFTYGDLTEEHLADLIGFGKGWTYGETEPVAGDVLGVTLTVNGSFDDGGYLVFVEGGYEVTVEHDEAYDGNYTFVIDGEKKLIVEKAEITVKDYDGIYAKDEEVYTVYDDNGILVGTNGYISNFVTKTKDFLNIAGYEDATVSVKFSERFDADGEIPDINGYRFMGDEVEEITVEGKYVYFFKIEIDNHKTLIGQLIVEVKADDYYLSLEIVKNKLTQEYGYTTPENLATWLIENGYAKYDEEVNAVVSKETFLSWVTATVYDENGEEVTGKLNVGSYKVVFGLNEEADERYSIYKATSRTVTIEITKCVIEIDWGNEDNLNYTYDGETHMPVITVAGLTDENGNPVTLKEGENEIIVNGEVVKVLVTVDGEFTEAGAYSVLITTDNENFEISAEGALRSVSITEPATEIPVPAEGGGVEDWKLWLIIAAAIVLAGIIIAIVVAAVKRRKIGDDDGFYDPVDESDL